MLVLKLAYSEELDFIEELQGLRGLLKKKSINIGLVESLEKNTHIIKIICDDDNYNEKIRKKIIMYVSNIMYKIIIEKYRKKELFEFLTDNYFFLRQSELLEAEEIIMKVLRLENSNKDTDFLYYSNIINEIIDKIKICIEENNEFNINGFLLFRMKELRSNIEIIIDRIIENYIIDKEYEEFIRLLKYFVNIQDSKLQEVNLTIQTLGGYSLTDGNGKDILDEFLKELAGCKIGVDANMEDIIISGLITNSPKRIIIHGKSNCVNKEFMDTIEKVFENKVIFCKGCILCVEKQVKL